MIKTVLISFGICCLIISGSSVAGADENTLDEITIRMISNDSLPIDVSEIELPDATSDHTSGRSNVAKQANEHAVQGSNNAASQVENAAENASNASENASSNAAEALSNAPGQNK